MELIYNISSFFGRLTQLGECNPYKVEVAGSSPASPTIMLNKCITLLFFTCKSGKNTFYLTRFFNIDISALVFRAINSVGRVQPLQG